MSRAKRIRITLGILLFIIGLATYNFGPALAPFAYMSEVADSTAEERSHVADMNYLAMTLGIGGIVIICVSTAFVFAEWASWFLGQSDQPDNS